MRRTHFALLLAAALLCSACVMTPEGKQNLKNGADVGIGNLREWEKLTPEQRYTAHRNLTFSIVVADHEVNGTLVPAEFADLAPVAS